MWITLVILGAVVAVVWVAAVYAFGVVWWMARGEPDVNGDIDRDAGVPTLTTVADDRSDRMGSDGAFWYRGALVPADCERKPQTNTEHDGKKVG